MRTRGGWGVWSSDFQEVESPWPLTPAQKYTQLRHQTPEYTRIRSYNSDIKTYVQCVGVNEEHDTNPLGPEGTGPPVKASRGEGGSEVGGGRKREGGRYPRN